jgi:hypothetical protein
MKEELYLKASKYGDTYLRRNRDSEDRRTFVVDVWINGSLVGRLELDTRTNSPNLIDL